MVKVPYRTSIETSDRATRCVAIVRSKTEAIVEGTAYSIACLEKGKKELLL